MLQSRIATVSTVKHAGPELDTWIAHYLAQGFERMYIVFDDPTDPDFDRVRERPGVFAIRSGPRLREFWKQTTTWGAYNYEDWIDLELQPRQILNAAVAMRLAQQSGFHWMLHIDADELMHFDTGDAPTWFGGLPENAGAVTILNYEGIPETVSPGDYLREMTLYKRSNRMLEGARLSEAQQALADRTSQIPERLFHFYDNGKSAVRLVAGARPDGVHQFKPGGELEVLEYPPGAQVLHAACGGFEAFWRKYRAYGNFSDTWWGQVDIRTAMGPTHTDSRDIVATDDREAALAFYRERFVIEDAELAEQLIGAGLCLRIDPFAG